jgi:hypothetical protein
VPTEEPTGAPSDTPTEEPTAAPSEAPTEEPTEAPTEEPTEAPTEEPTHVPTEVPEAPPTHEPTEHPTAFPTEHPTEVPEWTDDWTAAPDSTLSPIIPNEEVASPVKTVTITRAPVAQVGSEIEPDPVSPPASCMTTCTSSASSQYVPPFTAGPVPFPSWSRVLAGGDLDSLGSAVRW